MSATHPRLPRHVRAARRNGPKSANRAAIPRYGGRRNSGGGEPGASADWRQTVTTLVGIVSVLLVAAGLFYTNAANRAQQQLTEQGQVTDRFGRAIDQLGSGKLDIRLGGVYALERLMRDSPSDEANIIEGLSAYVRDHTRMRIRKPWDKMMSATADRADVQAVLTVLARRPEPSRHRNIDLTGAQIPGAALDGADLTGVKLRRADLTASSLKHAKLIGADLDHSNLGGVDLSGVDLSGAHLFYADLSDVDLSGANLSGTDFCGVDLSWVKWPLHTPAPWGWVREPGSSPPGYTSLKPTGAAGGLVACYLPP